MDESWVTKLVEDNPDCDAFGNLRAMNSKTVVDVNKGTMAGVS